MEHFKNLKKILNTLVEFSSLRLEQIDLSGQVSTNISEKARILSEINTTFLKILADFDSDVEKEIDCYSSKAEYKTILTFYNDGFNRIKDEIETLSKEDLRFASELKKDGRIDR